jgi:hypothetical protein
MVGQILDSESLIEGAYVIVKYTVSNSKKHKMRIIQLVVQNIIERGRSLLREENRNNARQRCDGGTLRKGQGEHHPSMKTLPLYGGCQ